ALFEEGAFTSNPRRRSGSCTRGGMETGDPLSPSSPSRSAAHSMGSEARSAVSSPRGTGSTLHLSSSEEVDVESSPQYEELLEVVTRAVAKLNIDWPAKPPSAHRSLPFFPDLHTEVARLWKVPFSDRLFIPVSYNYGNVAGMEEHGYRAMPRVEQTLASYLSPGTASSLKALVLPSKPLRVTSALVGKGYTVAGQAGACLHTMSVLQAYQADLLKELDEGEEIRDSDISELRRTADLSLHTTKESMAALVAAERHLWLTLSDMKEKDRVFLLDAPRSPSGLFGDAINLVVIGDTKTEQRHSHSSPSRSGTSKTRPDLRVVLQSKKRGAPHYSVSASPLCPQEAVLLTLPVLQGTVVSSECPPQFLLPGNAAERGVLPAGRPLQDTVLVAQTTPEASFEKLVPLVDHLAAWKLLPNVSAWVLRTVERGYHIQFSAPPPPFNGVSPTLVGPEQGLVMEQQVDTLLRKEAIDVVPPHDRESGFYSRYFIVLKKDGGLCPILDLRLLNHSVMRLKFKMLTIKQVVSQIRSEDWFVTIDLKDAYFHVSIIPQHRKFLRFAFRGEAYQYRVLPFGLALSPCTFTKCVDAALAPLRLQGIRILNYIDDWLILAQLEQVMAQHRDVVLAHMKELGLRLNAKKSVLSPLQRTTYLGMVWDSTRMQARLSPARIDERGPVIHCQAVSTTAGSDGSCVQCDTFWPAVHETPTVVAQDHGVLPKGALSVAPSFLDFAPGLAKAFLYPRAGYVPKVPSSAPRPVILQAFCPPPFREPEKQKLNCMCPVCNVEKTLSHWIVDAICCAYESSGHPPPLGVKAHSTRSMAASKAFHAGVSMQDICTAVRWSTPLTFVRFYDLDLQGLGGILAAVSTRLEFLKGNVSGYVCNPGSPRERDTASRGHSPAFLRALLLLKLIPVPAHVLLSFLVGDVTNL
ncbi:hypothetical protein M9458_056625, partial [Cirrhinus mrigala]